MLLPEHASEILKVDKPVYLEFRHVKATFFDISSLEVKKTDSNAQGFQARDNGQAKRTVPLSTEVYLISGKISDPDHKILDSAKSKCHSYDQFSYEKGRLKALEHLLGVPPLSGNIKRQVCIAASRLECLIKREDFKSATDLAIKLSSATKELSEHRISKYTLEFRTLVWETYKNRTLTKAGIDDLYKSVVDTDHTMDLKEPEN